MASNTHEGQHQAAHQSTDILHVREPSTFAVSPPVRRDERLGGTLLAESARAQRGSRPPTGQDAGSCGGCAGRGWGGGWKALRWRWAWPFASAGGAVALRAPSSPAARAAPFLDGSPARAPGGPGRGGHAPRAEVCGVAWSFPVPPDPKE